MVTNQLKNLGPHLNRKSLWLERVKFLSVPLMVAFGYSLTSGSLITYDGRQYLSTANSIRNLDLSQGYLFGRPPLYPIFLALLSFISDSDRFLIFCQVLMTSLSISFLIRIYNQRIVHYNSNLKFPRVLSLALILLPSINGYGTTILQHSLFLTEACLITAVLIIIITNPLELKNYIVFTTLIVCTFLTGQGMIPFVLTAILLLIILVAANQLRSKKRNWKLIFCTLIVCISIPATSILWASFESWGIKKNIGIVIPLPSGTSLLEYPKYFANDPQIAIENLSEAFAAQSGLTPSIGVKGLIYPNPPQADGFYENRVHAEYAFSAARKCGIADMNQSGEWFKYSLDVIKQTCAPISLPTVFYYSGIIGGLFLSLISTITLPLSILVLFGLVLSRKWKLLYIFSVLQLPSIALRVSYLLLGFQPDRYALPTFPFNLIFVWVLIRVIVRYFDKGISENQTQ